MYTTAEVDGTLYVWQRVDETPSGIVGALIGYVRDGVTYSY